MTDELVINESNFSQYFRDCRISKPEKNDVLAKYSAIAEFVKGRLKSDIIDLLSNYSNKAEAAVQVMRKLGCAADKDAIRVCKEIAKDLHEGMSVQDVENKIYKYVFQMFYYTKKDYVPKDDPHWVLIGIENLDSFIDANGNEFVIKSKVISKEKKN